VGQSCVAAAAAPSVGRTGEGSEQQPPPAAFVWLAGTWSGRAVRAVRAVTGIGPCLRASECFQHFVMVDDGCVATINIPGVVCQHYAAGVKFKFHK